MTQRKEEFISTLQDIRSNIERLIEDIENNILNPSDEKSYIVFMCGGVLDLSIPIKRGVGSFLYEHDMFYPDKQEDCLMLKEHIEKELLPIVQ